MSKPFKFSKPLWEVHKDKKVYGTPIFSLHEITLTSKEVEVNHPFYTLHAPEWINVIAFTPENEIILVEQYRAGTHQTTLEIPGGMVDKGESPAAAAQRELLEETGFISDDWQQIGKTSSNPAIMDNFTHLFLAKNCRDTGSQQTDGTEDIALHTIPFKDFLELIKNGTVHHAIVLAAVAQYLLLERNEY